MKQINWDKISISNDFLFGRVMRNAEICKELIETILGVNIDSIQYLEEQKAIDISKDSKSVRLDVYVSDGRETVFNVEMQTVNTGELPKRSRYYQGMIDLNLIDKGENYKKLNRSYVIFICTFDAFGKGRHIYTFENRCKEENIALNDGTTKIFLNAMGTVDDVNETLRAFLDYVAGKKTENRFVKKLDKEVEWVKENKEWRREFMTLFMRDQEKMEEGRKEGKIEVTCAMLKENIPLEMISKMTGFSIEEISELKDNNKL